jgi:hypothetical protein
VLGSDAVACLCAYGPRPGLCPHTTARARQHAIARDLDMDRRKIKRTIDPYPDPLPI